jgi:lysyl-tRNA synthetase class II
MASGCVPISNEFSAPSDYIYPLYPNWESFADVEEELGRQVVTNQANGFLVDYTYEPAVHMLHNPWYRFDQRWGRINMQDLIKQIRGAVDLKKNHPLWFNKVRANARATVCDTMSGAKFAEVAIQSLEGVLGGCSV